jgi:succinyldiaminopimelate transaminase
VGVFAPHSLPDFPWDSLAPFKAKASSHPDGLVDLSIGTPVDDVPEVIQEALAQNSNTPGYPTTIGTIEFRTSAVNWLKRKLDVEIATTENVIPTIGSKEIVAWLPTLLNLGSEHTIAIPKVAYPTYKVGGIISGCQVVTADRVAELEAARVNAQKKNQPLALVWINSPSNPTGKVLTADELREIVIWAQQNEIVVASDECYIELGWTTKPISILQKDVIGDSAKNILAVHSLSKRSNFAGYRAGVLVGDENLVKQILEVRKHAGMLTPLPVQAAAAAAFDDDEHVQTQYSIYKARRDLLKPALESAGFKVDYSDAGLYLWATRAEDCWATVDWFAQHGALVAPGAFYGEGGNQHVRIALTATDERISALVSRLP